MYDMGVVAVVVVITIFTVRRYALHGLSYRNSVRPSVRPSVCPSVTLVHCVHMVRLTIMISSPYGKPHHSSFWGYYAHPKIRRGVTLSEGVE